MTAKKTSVTKDEQMHWLLTYGLIGFCEKMLSVYGPTDTLDVPQFVKSHSLISAEDLARVIRKENRVSEFFPNQVLHLNEVTKSTDGVIITEHDERGNNHPSSHLYANIEVANASEKKRQYGDTLVDAIKKKFGSVLQTVNETME